MSGEKGVVTGAGGAPAERFASAKASVSLRVHGVCAMLRLRRAPSSRVATTRVFQPAGVGLSVGTGGMDPKFG